MVRPLVAAEAGYDWHQQERLKAAEIAGRHTGWTVWTARDGKSRLATRTGNQKDPNDGLWAATLICDDWAQLEKELAEQAQYDAERACLPRTGTGHSSLGA
jgi:hypothetical protein